MINHRNRSHCCEHCGEQSWRRLIDQIASGKLTVVDRLDERIHAFQEKMRQPLQEERAKKIAANSIAQAESNRLRQERKRRAAGIAPRGAQEELEKATGWRNEFGRLMEP